MHSFKNYVISTDRGRPPLIERLITAHMKGEDCDLSEEDQNVLKRWKVVQMLSMQHRPCISNAEIRRVLVKDFGITEITATKDITNAQRLFGNVNAVNKEFKRALYVDWLEQLASLAESKGDFKSAVAALKQSAEISRLNEDDGDDGSAKSRVFNLNLFFGSEEAIGRKTIDLEKVDEIPPTEFKELLAAVDRPRIGRETMKHLLEKHHGDSE